MEKLENKINHGIEDNDFIEFETTTSSIKD